MADRFLFNKKLIWKKKKTKIPPRIEEVRIGGIL